MNLQARYRAMVHGARPAPELDREVLASARRLRDAEGTCPSRPALIHAVAEKPRRSGPSFSRRAFVAAACGLGAVALAVGVPAALKRRDQAFLEGVSADSPIDPAELAKAIPDSGLVRPLEPARCGLAMLGEGPGPTAVPATGEGIVPVAYFGSRGAIDTRLNLGVWGEGIESVRYSLEGLLSVNDMGAAMGGGAMLVAAYPGSGPNGDASRQYASFKSQGLSLEGTVADDGSFLCPEGDLFLIYCMLPYEAVRAVDPVLDAYWSWNSPYQETVLSPDPTKEEETRAMEAYVESSEQANRLNTMLDELYADPDAFYRWMRGCYLTTVGLLGQQLQEGTLVLEASFVDGSYERHGYRIGLVDGYEEAAADRFDALIESSPYDLAAGETLFYETDDGKRDWYFDSLPFGFFLDGQPFDEAAAADPRLSRPLFTVEEIPA